MIRKKPVLHMCSISRYASAVLLFAVFASSAPARAYAPPSGFIVKSMAAKHSGPKGVRARSLVSSFDAANPVRFKVISVFGAESGLLRSWATDEAGQVLYAAERKVSAAAGGPGAVVALLFDSRLARVTDVLRKQGIPVLPEEELLAMKDEEERRAAETVTLGRWKKTFAWVLGVKSKPEAQLWVEKDTFLPLRLLAEIQSSSGPREALFENYRFYSEFPFPRLITWVEKNQAVLREELTDFLVNPPELKNLGQSFTLGYTDAGNAAPTATRELLQKYFETLR